MRQLEMAGERAGDGSLAAGCRAIDGDDEGLSGRCGWGLLVAHWAGALTGREALWQGAARDAAGALAAHGEQTAA